MKNFGAQILSVICLLTLVACGKAFTQKTFEVPVDISATEKPRFVDPSVKPTEASEDPKKVQGDPATVPDPQAGQQKVVVEDPNLYNQDLKITPPPAVLTNPTTETPVNNDDSSEIDAKIPRPMPSDIAETGPLRASIYYISFHDEDATTCASKVPMPGTDGKALLNVCPSTLKSCAMEGTCEVKQGGRTTLFNVVAKKVQKYKVVSNEVCPFGFGTHSICLDPYYTVAADPDFYQPGTVIYVPAIRGLELPNGKKHHGYLVVRDRGDNTTDRGVKGIGRFDFFTGHTNKLFDSVNPFARVGLASRASKLQYQRIQGGLADRIRQIRGYPGLPIPQGGTPGTPQNENNPKTREPLVSIELTVRT